MSSSRDGSFDSRFFTGNLLEIICFLNENYPKLLVKTGNRQNRNSVARSFKSYFMARYFEMIVCSTYDEIGTAQKILLNIF